MSELGAIFAAVGATAAVFLLLVGMFFLGMHLGMIIASGGTRGLGGIRKGKSFQAKDQGDGDDVPDPMKDFVGRQFIGWDEEEGKPQVMQGSMTYDEALKNADRQVKRFMDSTVFGRGPQRARSATEEDDV